MKGPDLACSTRLKGVRARHTNKILLIALCNDRLPQSSPGRRIETPRRVTYQYKSEMSEGSQVPTGAYRALLGNIRENIIVEHLDELLKSLKPYARVPTAQ